MKKILASLLTILLSLSSATFVYAEDSNETDLVYVVSGEYEWSIPTTTFDVTDSTASGSVRVIKAILEEYELLQISINGGNNYMNEIEGYGSSLKYNMQLEDKNGGYIDDYFVSYKIEQNESESNKGDSLKAATLKSGEIFENDLLISVPAGQKVDENGYLKTPVVETLNFTKTGDVIYAGEYKDILTFIVKVQSLFSIHRDLNSESTAWIRDDNLTGGFTVKASTDGTDYCSYFDILPIYKDIKRVVLDLNGNELEPTDPNYADGDVMVKIPKFYYQRYVKDNTEYINISPIEMTGYDLHPAFIRNDINGISHDLDYIYLGVYITYDGNNSKAGSSTKGLSSGNRNKFRIAIKNKNTNDNDGWSIIDVSTLSAIQILILVEYAENDVQSVIGQGVSFMPLPTTGYEIATGSCDALYEAGQITGSANINSPRHNVLWRGIEGLWGNSFQYVDGLNFYNGTYYVCNDIFKYADDTNDNYIALSYTVPTNITPAYTVQQGLDENNAWCMMPMTIEKYNSTNNFYLKKYYPDSVNCGKPSGWGTLSIGGSTYNSNPTVVGLFHVNLITSSTSMSAYSSSRIQYIPLS